MKRLLKKMTMNNQSRIRLPILYLFIVTLTYGQMNYQVTSIKFEGNKVIEDQLLSKQINTRDMNLKEKIFFWKKTPEFSSMILENDLERLQRIYQRNGFLEAEISKELAVNDNREKVSVIININEGQPVILKEIIYREHNPDSERKIIASIDKDIALHEGQRFQDANIYSAIDYLNRKYRNKGYPFVRIEKEVVVNMPAYEATVRFTIYPGVKAKMGKVIFEGNSLITRSFLKKKLAFEQGDVYSQEALEESQQEIFETGLFNYAIIRTKKDSIRNGSLPILIKVKELPQWSFEGGVGYGTEDRYRISTELLKRHFFGGARKLLLQAKRSYYLPVSLDVKLIQPDLFNREIDLVLNPFFSREREESYEVDRLGTGITLQKKLSPEISSYLTYSLEQANLLDKTLAKSDSILLTDQLIHNKSGITLGISKNSTDNIFEPTKGSRQEGYFTYMGLGFQSKYHYYQLGIETRHYKQVSPGYVLAGRIHTGIINPLQQDQSTPIEDRYLIGGASSLRGWARNTISPRNEEGEAIGGNIMFETSAELRFPIYDILSGTLFIDAGNVWREFEQFDFSDLYYGTGMGLRVATPIGPIRLDVGIPLFQENYNPQFFISLGHAF
ncbi:MAG: outer membrane protein assembly factor BamA [Fidelibacterota bacterium]